jgi:type VI secretion system secreted protein Hcp
MAADAYLKISDIAGESMDASHKDWIEVLSYTFEVNQSTTVVSTSGGATSGRADFSDFTITKYVDKSSPKLQLACTDGTHIKEVVLQLYRAGSNPVKYMEYKLSNCIISTYRPALSGSFPQELVSFNYGKIETTYIQQKRADGSGAGQIATGWDREGDKKI